MRVPVAFLVPSVRRLPWYGALAVGSLRRHPALFCAVAAAVFGACAALLAVLPPTYEVRCRLIARNPPAAAPRLDERADAPLRAAARLLHADAELRGIVAETGLVDAWRRNRPPLLRLKDRVLSRGARSEDLAESLAGTLADRIDVTAGRDGLVELTVRWSDRDTALRLAQATLRRYLALWQGLEVSSILGGDGDPGAAGGGPARRGRSAARRHAGERPRARGARAGRRGRRRRGRVEGGALPGGRRVRGPPDARDAPERRDRRATRTVRSSLDVDTRLRMRALRLALPLGSEADDDADADADDALAPEPDRERRRAPGLGEVDWRAGARLLEGARSGLAGAEQAYAALVDRLEAARIELDISRAAFEERYVLVVPPSLPREPVRPAREEVLLAAALDAILLAFLATTLVELRAAHAAGARAPGTDLEVTP